MTPRSSSRPGWRDVYDFVQGSETRILAAVREHTDASAEDHRVMRDDIRKLQDAALVQQGQRQGEARILGLGKSTIAIIVALAGALGPLVVGWISQILP